MILADETFRYAYDDMNECRRKIAQILARSPYLRTDPDEDKPLPSYPEWVMEYRFEMEC